MAASEKLTKTGLLGMNCQGDLGPMTMYVSARKKIVVFRKSPPHQPPTSIQQIQRNRFRTAAMQWRLLSNHEQARWEKAARAARLQCTGYNLFIQARVLQTDSYANTVSRQTGIDLT